jgi:hypothetical protein
MKAMKTALCLSSAEWGYRRAALAGEHLTPEGVFALARYDLAIWFTGRYSVTDLARQVWESAPSATIRHDAPRAADWVRVYGCRTVPIESPFPFLAELPGVEPQLVVRADLARLSPAQIARAAVFCAQCFGLEEDDVLEGILGDEGLPIVVDKHVELKGAALATVVPLTASGEPS